VPEIQEHLPQEEDLPDEKASHALARGAGVAVAQESFGHTAVAEAAADGGKRALIQYDYEKAEDNEIELREGDYVDEIEMVDDDWWMGTNSMGERGLFPSNYVELVEDSGAPAPGAGAHSVPPPPPPAEPEPEHAGSGDTPSATAVFDYDAAEDNELSFPEGAKVTNLEFPDDDWWFGHYQGQSGLFPANYVQLDE